MGKSILKIRRVHGEQYQPACYLASDWPNDDVPKPYEDPAVLDRLRQDFGLKRTTEPGLSLVMPWVDPEITFSDLRIAVVKDFYYAILAGGLTVELTDGPSKVELRRDNIVQEVTQFAPEHVSAIELAEWSLAVNDPVRLNLTALPPTAPQNWDPSIVPPDVRTAISDKLLEGQRVAVRVPVYIHEKSQPQPEPSYFDLYLERDDSPRTSRPSFFREQLAISSVKRALHAPKIRSLVVIEDLPLANLLRKAEPPNHTDWDMKSANFKLAFKGGNHVITFVKSAVQNLMSIVRGGDEKPDANVAIDFFAMPDPDHAPTPKGRPKKAGAKPDRKPAEFPPAKPRRFTIAREATGFVLRDGEPGASPPKKINVIMAYDVLSGSPWKQFDPADFDLTRKDRSGLEIVSGGEAKHRIVAENKIEVVVTGTPFEVYVTGFDTNRDLIVRAYDPKEPVDADPTPELYETPQADA